MRLKRSKLGSSQTLRLCEHFAVGTPARTAAELVGVNRNTAILFYHRLREIITARMKMATRYGAWWNSTKVTSAEYAKAAEAVALREKCLCSASSSAAVGCTRP